MTMFDYIKETMIHSLWNRLESIKMDPKSHRSDYSTFRSFLLGLLYVGKAIPTY